MGASNETEIDSEIERKKAQEIIKEDLIEIVNKNSFEYKSIIGKGGFGKVWKVNHKQSDKLYAMKEMSKAKIIDKKSEKSVKSERDLLAKLNHPFIINMHYSFQDTDNLYLVMDLLNGGDLRYHLCKTKNFSEEQTKFFLACMLLGLEYCHSNHIIHRDMKPENLVLDSNGYVHITDFGIAKMQQHNNYKETSGTPGYMSPEVMCAQNHTIAVDYFALGVMGYEFMQGSRPYLGKSRKEIKEKIMARQAYIRKSEIKEGWSLESADCINGLLQRKPSHRLGLHGAGEVKDHNWFRNFPWGDLYNKILTAPFIPPATDNFDSRYCNNVEKQGIKTRERYAEIIISDNYKTVFANYYYFNRFDKKSYEVKLTFLNIHERMYKNKDKNNYITNHYRGKSVATDFSKYHKTSDLSNLTGKGKENNYIPNTSIPAFHNRVSSASNIGINKAFFDANIYIKYRKMMKKNNSPLRIKLESNKSKRNIFDATSANNKITNNIGVINPSSNGTTEQQTRENFNTHSLFKVGSEFNIKNY